MDWTLHLPGVDATKALGRAIGRAAEPGTVLALDGDLGAGKTSLTQGIGAALGVRGPVTSPTFQLLFIHEDGRIPLLHADLYRLGDVSELQEIGLDELLGVRGISVIEWAQRFPEVLPDDHIALRFTEPDPESRDVHLRALGPRSAALLERLRSSWS